VDTPLIYFNKAELRERWLVWVFDIYRNQTAKLSLYGENGTLLASSVIGTFTQQHPEYWWYDIYIWADNFTNTVYINGAPFTGTVDITTQVDWLAFHYANASWLAQGLEGFNMWLNAKFGYAGGIPSRTQTLELYYQGKLVRKFNLTFIDESGWHRPPYNVFKYYVDNSSDTYQADYMVLRDTDGTIVQTIDGIYLQKPSSLPFYCIFWVDPTFDKSTASSMSIESVSTTTTQSTAKQPRHAHVTPNSETPHGSRLHPPKTHKQAQKDN
jgi:hypothetical protein